MDICRRRFVVGAGASLAALSWAGRGAADSGGALRARFEHLVASYPDFLAGLDGDALIWKDGAHMMLHAARPARDFEIMLRDATLADQLRQVYRAGKPSGPPAFNDSPGRIRHTPFFAKMYGDCGKDEVMGRLRPVKWMPKTKLQTIKVAAANDVAGRLERVIAQLETLPDRLKAFLTPSAGIYNCRVVADTGQPSMHASGAAIDIATAQSDYWVWAKGKGGREIPFKNRIPWEIVEIFEAEKFIWGGKWHHYDTMHFEYRPEMFG
jgi:hypothetical protein